MARWFLLFFLGGMLLGLPGAWGAESAVQQLSPDVFQEVVSGRMWQVGRSPLLRTKEEVATYLKALNTTGDYHDWRLPRRFEVEHLFELFDWKRAGDIELRLEGSYWFRDEQGTLRCGRWHEGDQCGIERTYSPAPRGYLRAVRP